MHLSATTSLSIFCIVLAHLHSASPCKDKIKICTGSRILSLSYKPGNSILMMPESNKSLSVNSYNKLVLATDFGLESDEFCIYKEQMVLNDIKKTYFVFYHNKTSQAISFDKTKNKVILKPLRSTCPCSRQFFFGVKISVPSHKTMWMFGVDRKFQRHWSIVNSTVALQEGNSLDLRNKLFQMD